MMKTVHEYDHEYTNGLVSFIRDLSFVDGFLANPIISSNNYGSKTLTSDVKSSTAQS